MVNTGRPSRGCHSCRKRRVKCDEGRPACQNCQRLTIRCPGYREDAELTFRNATKDASMGGTVSVVQRKRSSESGPNPTFVFEDPHVFAEKAVPRKSSSPIVTNKQSSSLSVEARESFQHPESSPPSREPISNGSMCRYQRYASPRTRATR